MVICRVLATFLLSSVGRAALINRCCSTNVTFEVCELTRVDQQLPYQYLINTLQVFDA